MKYFVEPDVEGEGWKAHFVDESGNRVIAPSGRPLEIPTHFTRRAIVSLARKVVGAAKGNDAFRSALEEANDNPV